MKHITISDILRFISIFQFLLFSFFLIFYKRGNSLRNKLLAVFLLSKALCYIDFILFRFRVYFIDACPHVFLLGYHFDLLLGPALLLYTKSFLVPRLKLRAIDSLHLLPFISHIIYLSSKFHLHSAVFKRELLINNHIFSPLEYRLNESFIYLHFIIYAIIAIIILYKYRLKVKSFYSTIEKTRLIWLNIILFGFLLIWLLALSNTIYWWPLQWNLLVLSIFIYANLIVFWGLKQPELFGSAKDAAAIQKYIKSSLKEKDKDRYVNKIKNFMQTQKPYLDPNITLTSFANQLSISPHHLSQLINERFQCNFYDFINEHRIEEAKQLLTKPQSHRKVTVLEILYAVGFNSKSVFNTAFKKYVGMTPTRFRNRTQNKSTYNETF
jgi:AraC-like DNA-binding protein